LELLSLVREKVLETLRGQPDNAALFHRLVASPLRQAIVQEDKEQVLLLLETTVGEFLPRETLQELADQALGGQPAPLVAD
jgi:hypothetical protein